MGHRVLQDAMAPACEESGLGELTAASPGQHGARNCSREQKKTGGLALRATG